MTNPLKSDQFQERWDTEEIRFLVLTSLAIQILLTCLAPQRKSCSMSFLKIFIWMLYLLADVVAMYTIGLISNHRGHRFTQAMDLLALWASFLLLHLGGPDTITALALEDNELWRRHALQLATQVTVTVYVFIRSFQQTTNHLWLPTVLVFADGFIKYFERTCALFYASRDNFRDSIMTPAEAGPNYARLMEEYFSAKSANIPAKFEPKRDSDEGKENLNDAEGAPSSLEDDQKRDAGGKGGSGDDDGSVHSVDNNTHKNLPENEEKKELMIREAHVMYDMYKPLLAEGFLSLRDRERSRKIMFSYHNEDAFRLIEIELNLIYDTFYTKSFLLQKRLAVFRFICFLMIVASSVLFLLKCGSVRHKTDIIISVTLFCGAITLDICTFIMFVGSDWWIIEHSRQGPRMKNIMGKLLYISRRFRNYESKRWSNTMSKHNLLKFCFRKPPPGVRCISCGGIKYVKDFLDEFCYVNTKPIVEKENGNLLDFIRGEIWVKAELAEEINDAKKVHSARGNLVLETDYYLASECLKPWTLDLDYDESLMVWHVATDICYWTADNNNNNNNNNNKWKKYSKELSDYMLYLVIWKQSLLSSVVGMSETRFNDTCAEARKFMNDNIHVKWHKDLWSNKCTSCGTSTSSPANDDEENFYKSFCEKVLGVKAVVEPMVAKGDKSKSVLFDACRLAKQLQMFREDQWEITAKVWLELLCYAAVRCSPRYHIAQLSKGGELITLVWLFMAHLGIGERFLQNQGFGLTKLVIGK